jgi:AbrB family looped-hinge helix DNA binding protein
MSSSTLTSKGQVTVPAHIRKALGLRTGDRLWFTVRDGLIEVDKRGYAERTAGMLAGRAAPTKDIQARIREEKRAAEVYAAEVQAEKLRRVQ